MPKVVFDTVVFVRTLINPHNYCGRAVFEHSAGYRLFLSAPIVREILEVLHREELTRRFRRLAGLDLARIIELLGAAEIVEVPSVAKVSRDPKDDIFLATAIAADADYLVSEDEDLLVLGEHHGIKIVTCSVFLDMLRNQGAHGGPKE